MDDAGLSSRVLAQRVTHAGTPATHQNIEHIVAGKQLTCKRDLRGALAQALGLPSSEWLGSEQDLPDLPWWEAPRTLGVEGISGTDMNQRALPGTRWSEAMKRARELFKVPEARRIMPPRYQLLAWRLARGVEDAWARSTSTKGESAEYPAVVADGETAIARRAENGYVPLYSLPAIAVLLSLAFWRRAFLNEPYGGLVDPKEMDAFAEGMAKALRTLLRPWLDGEVELRSPDQLEALFASLAGFGKTLARIEARSHFELRDELVRQPEQQIPTPPSSAEP